MPVDEVAFGRLAGLLEALIQSHAEFREETNEHLADIRDKLQGHATELDEARGEKSANRRTAALISACVSGLVAGGIAVWRWATTGHP